MPEMVCVGRSCDESEGEDETTEDHARAAFGGSVFLSGCLAVENIETPAEVVAASSSADSSIVYGRVKWVENGNEIGLEHKDMFGQRLQRVVPRLKRAEDNSTVTVELDNAGHFVWSLQKGTYIIDKLQVNIPGYGSGYFVPKVAFKVPDNGKSYYIGTLRADAVVDADFWGTDGVAKFSIEDSKRSEDAYAQRKLGNNFSAAQKSLMVQNENLPDSFDTTTEFNIIMTILGAPW